MTLKDVIATLANSGVIWHGEVDKVFIAAPEIEAARKVLPEVVIEVDRERFIVRYDLPEIPKAATPVAKVATSTKATPKT